MRVFRGFDDLPRFVHGVATVGSFDGVHRGHFALLSRVCEMAKQTGGESIVFTFDPHPRITLGKAEGLRLLDSTAEKLLHLEQAGIDNVVFIPFTEAFSRLTAEEFISDYIVGRGGVKSLVVGYNHRFGCDRKGDFAFLSAMGLEVVEVGRLEAEGDKVSSTVIRKSVASGDLTTAWRLLGHPYMVSGELSADGELLISEREYKLLPPAGEYNARVDDDCEFHLTVADDGAVSIDYRLPESGNGENVFVEILGKR